MCVCVHSNTPIITVELREIYMFYSNLIINTYGVNSNNTNNTNNNNNNNNNNTRNKLLTPSKFELSQRMVMQQLWAFVRDCRLLSPHFTLADVNRIALHHSINNTDHGTKVNIYLYVCVCVCFHPAT